MKWYEICTIKCKFALENELKTLTNMRLKHLVLLLSVLIGLSSCVVSKKKYEALESAKRISDSKVRKLLREKQELIATVGEQETTIGTLTEKAQDLKQEFNDFKYAMSESNAQKSTDIDKLTRELTTAQKAKDTYSEKSKELESDLEWLRKERQRNSEKIAQLEATIKEMEREKAVLETSRQSIADAKQSAEEKIKALTDDIEILKLRLERSQVQNAKLQKELVAKGSGATTTSATEENNKTE